MTKLNKAILILLLLCTLVFSVFFPITAYALDGPAFDKLNVMDDLQSSKDFNILNYPFKDNGDAEIINVVEYCYSPYEEQRGNYGLYVYIYNSNARDIATGDKRNTVQLKISDNNGVATYEKLSLEYINKSEDSKYNNRFYKFKVLLPYDFIKSLNPDRREYEISGFELVYKNNQLPSDFSRGGNYVFVGFAKGYGYRSEDDSTLNCEVIDTEYINISDLTFTTDISDNNNANGVGHYNQINSVFWTMPNYFEKEYGNLQKINFEYSEYKTSPILVTKDADLYSKAFASRSKTVEPFKHSNDIPFEITYGVKGAGVSPPVLNYDFVFNKNLVQNSNLIERASRSASQMPLIFHRPDIGSRTNDVTAAELLEYIYGYTESYHNGKLENRNISLDLFMGKVDSGHIEGYQNKWIDANDIINLFEYDLNSGWNKFWYNLFGVKPEELSQSFKPIQRITNVSDLDGLNIGVNEKEAFIEMFEGLTNDKYMYLFTFAVTDYFSAWLDGFNKDKGYIAETTAFLDFDMIAFTFCKAGEYTTIPVVSDPIDIISGIWSPVDKAGCGLKCILKIIFIIVAVIVLAILLWKTRNIWLSLIKGIFKVIWAIISYPFKAVATLFKK